jgi:hypothetical protein
MGSLCEAGGDLCGEGAMGDEGLGKMVEGEAGDKLKDVATDVVNLTGRLAEEELWRRSGGAERGEPAPWDVAAAEDAAWEAKKVAEGQVRKPATGAMARALTDEEAGIVMTPALEAQITNLDEEKAAREEAQRKSDWEAEGPKEDVVRWLHRHGIG